MKNLKTYFKLSSAILMLFFLTSCEDYLEEEPTSQFTADFVYNTEEGLATGVVGLYNFQREFWESSQNNGSNPIIIDAKDDLNLPRGGEISRYGRMINGTTPENSNDHGDYWRTYYRILDRANALIEAAENITDIEDDNQNQILSEAKFFRAHSVFVLFRLFNNIYVTTEPTTPENATDIILDKSPEADIYALVNTDLEFAIANLDWESEEAGRITQGTARHLKAEVALWQENWAEAKEQAEAVINSGYFSLVPDAADVFTGDLNHSEALWTLQWLREINGNPHKINFNLMPNYPESIPGSQYSKEQGGRGFSWLTMNNYIRDLLNEDPNDTRIKGTYYIQDYFYNDPATVPDPELLGTKIVHPEWQEFSEVANNRRLFFVRLTAGCKKYFSEDSEPSVNNHPKNIMMARLAETYLFAAEANMRLNNTAAAIDQLNAVRNRAETTSVDAINLETLLEEQARELAFEGRRWYMLKRTGKLYEYVTDHAGYGMAGDLSEDNSEDGGGNNTPERPVPYRNDARRNMEPHMVNWVIPISEMNLLGPNYPQNDGY